MRWFLIFCTLIVTIFFTLWSLLLLLLLSFVFLLLKTFLCPLIAYSKKNLSNILFYKGNYVKDRKQWGSNVPLCLLHKLFRVKWAGETLFIKIKTFHSGCSRKEQQHTISIQKIMNHHIQSFLFFFLIFFKFSCSHKFHAKTAPTFVHGSNFFFLT